MAKKRRKPTPKIISPDHKLDTVQFKHLNLEFYEGFDPRFVTWRLGALCIINEAPAKIEELLASGVSWGELELKAEPTESSLEEIKKNIELELVALRQHAAEVLFRLFWVHAHEEPCPWIALARLRKPGDLKAAIDNYLSGALWKDSSEKRRLHAKTIWGTTAVDSNGSIRSPLDQSVDAATEWVAVAAAFVKDAPLYNAYKHGLAVLASQPFSLKLGSLSMDAGSGFSYINRVLNSTKTRHYWHLATEPIDFEVVAAEAAIFGLLITAIVRAGALDRGVTEPPQEVPVLSPESTPDNIRHAINKPSAHSIQNFGQSLAYLE